MAAVGAGVAAVGAGVAAVGAGVAAVGARVAGGLLGEGGLVGCSARMLSARCWFTESAT